MKIEFTVTYTPEEIQTMLATLKLLCEFDRDDRPIPQSICNNVDKAFDGLAELICLDPEGRKAYEHEGWCC